MYTLYVSTFLYLQPFWHLGMRYLPVAYQQLSIVNAFYACSEIKMNCFT